MSSTTSQVMQLLHVVTLTARKACLQLPVMPTKVFDQIVMSKHHAVNCQLKVYCPSRTVRTVNCSTVLPLNQKQHVGLSNTVMQSRIIKSSCPVVAREPERSAAAVAREPERSAAALTLPSR